VKGFAIADQDFIGRSGGQNSGLPDEMSENFANINC
jgi:hypothetical protein